MKTIMSTLMFVFAASAAVAEDNLKAFPPAGEGMVRYVLQLQEQTDESDYRMELIVGRTVRIDAQNRYFFTGQIEAETIKGWGFTRYVVRNLGPMAGTLMAIDTDAPKVERFITLGGDPCLVRYNSRLPVVIYVPEGVDVRYRIWSAGAEVKALERG